MSIKELDYIILRNRLIITSVLMALRNIVTGFDGVIDKRDLKNMMELLNKWEEQLYEKTIITREKNNDSSENSNSSK